MSFLTLLARGTAMEKPCAKVCPIIRTANKIVRRVLVDSALVADPVATMSSAQV
ncbi:hypothetical protein PQR66_26985 [Paraburkholderia agricolaris]|uniref:Uncharacterized protein n=1 Tax=Paraburkholderia agricolaris TaxID=2152888 RepID=A0ABW8ZVY9_9BURK